MKLSQLTEWFIATIGHGKRKGRMPRTGLSVEPLESRIVLSASMGSDRPHRFDVGNAPLVAWQRPNGDGQRQPPQFSGDRDHHHHHAPPTAFGDWPGGSGGFDRPSVSGSSTPPVQNAPGNGPISVTIVTSGSQSRPPRSEAPAHRSASDFEQPPAAAGVSVFRGPEPSEFFVAFSPPTAGEASFVNFDAEASSTATPARSESATAHQLVDSAIQEYFDRGRWRAASAEAEDADETEDSSIELSAFAADETDEFAALRDAQLEAGINTALEVLSRERKAIDALLTELHQPTPTAEQAEHATDGDSPSDGVASQATEDSAQGGMVWLVPTGDANHSVTDLQQAVLGKAATNPRAAVVVEVSLGVYQAFDDGEAQLLPAADANHAPIAPPAAERTDVSADSQLTERSNHSG